MILPDNCPSCGVTWIGEPIPQEERQHYGSRSHFRRQIADYDPYLDCRVGWWCPDCGFYLARPKAEISLVAETNV